MFPFAYVRLYIYICIYVYLYICIYLYLYLIRTCCDGDSSPLPVMVCGLTHKNNSNDFQAWIFKICWWLNCAQGQLGWQRRSAHMACVVWLWTSPRTGDAELKSWFWIWPGTMIYKFCCSWFALKLETLSWFLSRHLAGQLARPRRGALIIFCLRARNSPFLWAVMTSQTKKMA